MAQSWKRFVYVHVLFAAIVLLAGTQIVAVALSHVPRYIFRADELAMTVVTDQSNYRILLLGDSKTSRATERFALGGPGEVANLSTHMLIGLSGSLFLVQRYLQNHPAPEHIVLAVSPPLYGFENNERLSRYHLWHTFTRPEERRFLAAHHPGMDRRDALPAILDLQEQVLEPLASLVRLEIATLRGRRPVNVPAGWITPDAEIPVMYSANLEVTSDEQAETKEARLNLASVNKAVIRSLCDLSGKYGFKIHVIWPPMPHPEQKAISASGALGRLEAQILGVMDNHCRVGEFVDLNRTRTYYSSSFQHDLLHLFGDGWEQRYASDLREYLGGLLRRKIENATSARSNLLQ